MEIKSHSEVLKFGVVGLGSIAKVHIQAINQLDTCELKAICSSSAERVTSLAADYGVKGYTDVRQMLAEESLDILCICTASGFHLEPTLAAAAAGVHVICEKPLEINLERTDQMINACKEAGVTLACIFQNRYKEAFRKIQKAVSDGLLGKLVLGNAYVKWYRDQEYYLSRPWRGTLKGDGGAALINQSIHTIDLLQLIMGPVRSVFGKTKTLTHDIEGEDVGLAILSFENGALGTIEGSTSIYPGYEERLEIFGEKGSIIYEGGNIIKWDIMDQDSTLAATASGGSGASDPSAISNLFHQLQIAEIVAHIRAGLTPEVDGIEGRKSLEIIQAIYQSAKSGKEVFL